MATKKNRLKKKQVQTAAENILAGALGTAAGYATGVGATKLILTKTPYAKRLAKLPLSKRLKEISLLRGSAAAGSAAAGSLAGLAARQRLRKARKEDKLTRKLAEFR